MNTTGELPNPGTVTVTGSASTATPTKAVAAYALARVLGRHCDGIEYRGSHHSLVEELARDAKVPVWSGLTDEAPLAQILADLTTMQEFGERPLRELSFCYRGDASSYLGGSLLVGGTHMGMDVRTCAPAALQPPPEREARMRELARATGKVTPQALAGYDFAADSTGPKAEAARAFVVATGQRAVIGSLDRIEDMRAGRAGTQVRTEAAGGAGFL
jgi:hypothetical protein